LAPGQRDAEHDGEEDQPEHVAGGGGAQGVARHDVDERVDAEAGVLGGLDALGGLRGILGEQAGADGRVQAGAGLHHVGQDQAEGGREGSGQHEHAERLATHSPEAAHVAQAGHAERQGREDQGDHHHEQHAEEDLADRVGHRVDDPLQPRRAVPEQVADDAGTGAQQQAQHDLGVQRHAPTRDRVLAHVSCHQPCSICRGGELRRAAHRGALLRRPVVRSSCRACARWYK
jgi:hypothetical protein